LGDKSSPIHRLKDNRELKIKLIVERKRKTEEVIVEKEKETERNTKENTRIK
jgi:hypothetical protein